MRIGGLSLVELLVTLAVAAVLFGMSFSPARHLLQQTRAAARANHLTGAVHLARAGAITLGQTTTLCASAGSGCGQRDTWHEGLLIFADDDGNGRLNGEEKVLHRLPPLYNGARAYWRSFRNRAYLQFLPTGLTPWQNGSFLICPEDGDERYARQLILNAQGRLRAARDADGDGIQEDVQGRPLSC